MNKGLNQYCYLQFTINIVNYIGKRNVWDQMKIFHLVLILKFRRSTYTKMMVNIILQQKALILLFQGTSYLFYFYNIQMIKYDYRQTHVILFMLLVDTIFGDTKTRYDHSYTTTNNLYAWHIIYCCQRFQNTLDDYTRQNFRSVTCQFQYDRLKVHKSIRVIKVEKSLVIGSKYKKEIRQVHCVLRGRSICRDCSVILTDI